MVYTAGSGGHTEDQAAGPGLQHVIALSTTGGWAHDLGVAAVPGELGAAPVDITLAVAAAAHPACHGLVALAQQV